jgi:hypothetical protein
MFVAILMLMVLFIVWSAGIGVVWISVVMFLGAFATTLCIDMGS